VGIKERVFKDFGENLFIFGGEKVSFVLKVYVNYEIELYEERSLLWDASIYFFIV